MKEWDVINDSSKKVLFICIVVAACLIAVLIRLVIAQPNTSAKGTVVNGDNLMAPSVLRLFFTGSIGGSGEFYGIQNDDVILQIHKDLGIQLEFVKGSTNEDLLPMYASGNLPEIISLSDSRLLLQIIETGNAKELDELIELYGADILKNAPDKIEYSRIKYSNDTGKLYCIPGASGPAMKTDVYSFGFNVRWDLYEKLGYPKAKTYLEMLDILKDMQRLAPMNKEGKPTYAVSFTSDWDVSTVLHTLQIGPMYGWDITEHLFHAEIDTVNDYEAKNMLDEDSWMFKGAEFLNKAYRAGLLDPGSINQSYGTFINKIENEQILMCWNYWYTSNYNLAMADAGTPERGLMPIYPLDSTTMWRFGEEPLGLNSSNWIISEKSQYADKTMEFLNYINMYDGSMLIFSGIKDKHWRIEDGKPISRLAEYGGTESGCGKYFNMAGLNNWTIHPDYGFDLGLNPPESYEGKGTFGVLWQSYIDYFGVDRPYMAYDLQRTADTVSDIYRPFMSVMPESIAIINQNISNLLKSELYNAIFSESDADFIREKNQIISKACAMGSDLEFEWVLEERIKAKKLHDAFIETP